MFFVNTFKLKHFLFWSKKLLEMDKNMYNVLMCSQTDKNSFHLGEIMTKL